MNADVVNILPPVHALTRCDTLSKIASKAAALKVGNEYGDELLCFLVRLK